MIQVKTNRKKWEKTRGYKLLTKNELTLIRSFMPRKWRKMIAERHTGLSIRQITEVFNQRSRTPGDNIKVWQFINEVLVSTRQPSLVQRVEEVISFYQDLYNIIHL